MVEYESSYAQKTKNISTWLIKKNFFSKFNKQKFQLRNILQIQK